MEDRTLFQRLGGEQGIASLVNDIVAAHMQNPVVGPRFRPYSADVERLDELKDHMRRFLAQGGGGPMRYEGRTMPDAHRGMNISVEEYMAAVDDIMGTLERHGVEESARKDVLAITYQLKDEIVHV